MSLEAFPGNRSPFSPASPEQARPSVGNRLQEALKNPELQKEAKDAARRIGDAALRGAVERSGLGKIDDDGDVKIRKLGVLKAAFNPRKAAVNAARGAVSGARKGVVDEAFHQTQKHLGNIGQHQPEQISSYTHPAEIESRPWSTYAAESTPQQSIAPAAETYSSPFGGSYSPDMPTASFESPTTYEQPVSPWSQSPTSETQSPSSWGSSTSIAEAPSPFSGSTKQNDTATSQPFKWS